MKDEHNLILKALSTVDKDTKHLVPESFDFKSLFNKGEPMTGKIISCFKEDSMNLEIGFKFTVPLKGAENSIKVGETYPLCTDKAFLRKVKVLEVDGDWVTMEIVE